MPRRMTVVFRDEDLYTNLRIEAIRRRRTASDILSEALQEWMASREDATLVPLVREARAEWEEEGGRPWEEVERTVTPKLPRRKKATSRHVQG